VFFVDGVMIDPTCSVFSDLSYSATSKFRSSVLGKTVRHVNLHSAVASKKRGRGRVGGWGNEEMGRTKVVTVLDCLHDASFTTRVLISHGRSI
jgi:hypothetical protein